MLKPIKFTTSWGSTIFLPSANIKNPNCLFIDNRGPRGGAPRTNFITVEDALALSKYLETWALERLKTNP